MENMDIKKLKSKNILVTGGAGFIGSHLVDRLITMGNRVIVVDNLSSGRKENINKKSKFYEMDIRDPRIAEVLKKEGAEIVFHLAAQSIVETAYSSPFETIESNIMGTTNLLEVCRLNGKLKSIVVSSSDKAYGKSDKLPYTEESPLKGDHPYDVSKTATDLLAQTYAKTYNLPITITRFSNVFGPGDLNFNRVIPGIFEAIIKNKEFLVRSDGKMVREYTYVEDVVSGYIKLVENSENILGEAFNFGSKNIFSVIDIVKKIEEILNVKISYKILNIAKNEIPKQYLNWSKAKKILGWKPKTSFEDGIKNSFNWYKNFFVSPREPRNSYRFN
ncbi:MAG: NAD-dependent epimerase/dehydratase [Parcubacteria group bacterium GW2011_GWF2_43_11]|nr:MAG: NAD-dependent epimerase/dehydratase [Parcubacteria group bacterium GW2011_GWF2_43_11]